MSKLTRRHVVTQQLQTKWNRWPVWITVIVSVVVSAGWLWLNLIEPQQLYYQAMSLLDENPRRAAELLEAAVRQSGGEFPEAQLQWSRAFLRLGQPQQALGCFSVISDPSTLSDDGLITLADEARDTGEFLLATFALQAVPERSGRFVEASHQLIELKSEQGRFTEVLSLGNKLIDRQADLPIIAFLMAGAHEQSADLTAAAAAYETYLRESEGEPSERVAFALGRLMKVALQLGQLDVARRCLDNLQKSSSLTVDGRLSQAELLRAEGNIDAAWAIVDTVLKDDPSNLSAVTLRATLAFDRQEDALAEQDLRRILQFQPWNKLAHYKLAQVLQRTGRSSEADTHFRENRRLTELALRVLTLQKEASTDTSQEIARLQELAKLYRELGQTRMAGQLQQQVMQQRP
ncbi:tetratricopeptide repeat protein [bacterium]|nr:tetratricopeptide repeat protein [bacterium]